MSEYDENDQAYQDLLDECDTMQRTVGELRAKIGMYEYLITQICDLIHYQAHLKHQDEWLAEVIEMGLYTTEEE